MHVVCGDCVTQHLAALDPLLHRSVIDSERDSDSLVADGHVFFEVPVRASGDAFTERPVGEVSLATLSDLLCCSGCVKKVVLLKTSLFRQADPALDERIDERPDVIWNLDFENNLIGFPCLFVLLTEFGCLAVGDDMCLQVKDNSIALSDVSKLRLRKAAAHVSSTFMVDSHANKQLGILKRWIVPRLDRFEDPHAIVFLLSKEIQQFILMNEALLLTLTWASRLVVLDVDVAHIITVWLSNKALVHFKLLLMIGHTKKPRETWFIANKVLQEEDLL